MIKFILLIFIRGSLRRTMLKIIMLVVLIVVTIIAIQFIKLYGVFRRGNRQCYNLEFVEREPINQIDGLSIIYLGSSVMAGMEAGWLSFADYISKRHDVKTLKVCRSGTTLADISSRSYIARLKLVDDSFKPDYIIVQLSTNDARRKVPLGIVSIDCDLDSYDTRTTTGAIEYIVTYVSQRFNCPVIFYTGTPYVSERYLQIVNRLFELQSKHDFEIIDMYNDKHFNAISDEERKLYLTDGDIHPTKAGYLLWWTPYIEEQLVTIIERRKPSS